MRWDVLGKSWWTCCDECDSSVKDSIIVKQELVVRAAYRHMPPRSVITGYSVLRDAQMLGYISHGGRLLAQSAQLVAAGSEITAKMLGNAFATAAGTRFHIKRSRGMVDAIKNMLSEFDGKIAMNYGVSIWVYLEWKRCESRSCIIPWRRHYDWKQYNGWKMCSAGMSGPLGVGFEHNDVAGISDASVGCISEAINELVP